MSIILKKRLIPVLFSIFIIFPITAYAAASSMNYAAVNGRFHSSADDPDSAAMLTPSINSNYTAYDYVIDRYDVHITVNENNTYDITETITAYFNYPKHGIYRKIPLRNIINRLDGTSSQNIAKISDVTVDHVFTKSVGNNSYQLKIGSADITLTGEQKYVISYHYNIGKDPVKNYDELYYNIIGDEWDTAIGNVTFQILMPKEFDSRKLGFSSGARGSTANDKINYKISGNTITGSYDGILEAGEALTVRMELPEGYFVGAGHNSGMSVWLVFIIPGLCLLISSLLWLKYGKNDKIIETVEFYPPQNLNSLELGYLYKGKADSNDVVSLLIYLADKGYIKILEIEDKSLFTTTKDFQLIKQKEYDGYNSSERKFLKSLFLYGSDGKVSSLDLTNKFHTTIDSIKNDINAKENKSKIFEETPFFIRLSIILMLILSMFIAVGIPTLQYAGISELFTTCFLLLFYTPFYAVMFFATIPKLFRLLWGGFVVLHSCAFFFNMPIAKIIFIEPIYLVGLLFALICVLGMGYFRKAIPKRTPYGNEMLGKIRGFKTFLETAEKNRLETLVMQDPAYFYHILPYSYVLGVSDKWIKKFESIALQAPSWYDSNSDFNTRSFHSFMNNTMSSAQRSMTSSPSSSGSGSSSGGGSSGGGSGGGGGSSW